MLRPSPALPVVRPGVVSALLSLPPPLAVGWVPLLCPQGCPPPSGEEVPLGEEEEQGGVAGLHLGGLLLRPYHQRESQSQSQTNSKRVDASCCVVTKVCD